MTTETTASPKWMYWAGWVMSLAPFAMLLMSAYAKISQSEQAVNGFKSMNFPDGVLVPLGIVELACAILYMIPQTSVLGAILVVGYLGGATEVHFRMADWGNMMIPVVLGVLAWGGLFLRDARVRTLIPITR